MKRTKISKESLLSIGFKRKVTHLYLEFQEECFIEVYTYQRITVRIEDFDLERTFEYIDEITTLLQGLTGKNQFKK